MYVSRRIKNSKSDVSELAEKIETIEELSLKNLEKIVGVQSSKLALVELRQMADDKLSEKLKLVQSNTPLCVSIIENSVFIILKVLEFYTEPMISAKENYQVYGNKTEMAELCGQMKAVLTDSCFEKIREAVTEGSICPSVFVNSNIRELQHLMIMI